ncbi:hypothetical protein F53441_11539 [Fusarium austroafricanum]|uniref:F-box domain-containing protein n=1 Tax=Fusarium austroafricanum TaxID=2364996 RepID=A0A8H4K1V6_9HYPO|nr:hypothetical protein F53441_11539 [Fusarium austroafricanum]
MQKLKRLLLRRRPQPGHESPASTSAPTPAPKSPSIPASTPAISAEISCLSKLEKLPFEIRNEILLAVDTIEDLCALVHASPTFHQQYRLDRIFWLWHCLQAEMGHCVFDAYIASQCNTPEFRLKRTREKSLEFIEEYKLQRSKFTGTPPEQLYEDDIISMATFHSSIVCTLAHEYIAWTRTNLEGLSVPDQTSRIEQKRIIRGMYRFQIFCNLFGAVRDAKYERRAETLELQERLELFLSEYEPWEIEEILCINAFSEAQYDKVFEEVQWDLHPNNPAWYAERTDPFTPPNAYCLLDDNSYRDGMVSLGLPVLSATFKTQDHSKLVKLISSEVVSLWDGWLLETTEQYHQERRRDNLYSDRDKAQDSREKMGFNGDKDDSPSLTWVTMWKETYSNLYGDMIPAPLRKWGYIMWDRNRVVNSGALAIIDEEWKSYYWRVNDDGEREDPRNDMLTRSL